jgi:hypothetical protein
LTVVLLPPAANETRPTQHIGSEHIMNITGAQMQMAFNLLPLNRLLAI